MKALIQRVSEASVQVAGETVGEISRGLLALIGIEREDTRATADKLLARLLAYRVFADEKGHMNLSLAETGGGLLLVSQFTLVADTQKGLRPSFSSAAAPDAAESLFSYLLAQAGKLHQPVASGCFGKEMQVHLINAGPVTFLLEIQAGSPAGGKK